MDKKTVFEGLNEIKDVVSQFANTLIDFCGSPDEADGSVSVMVKGYETVKTFNGEQVFIGIKKNTDGSILYGYAASKSDAPVWKKNYDIPVETLLVMTYVLSHENNIGEAFDEIFTGITGE